MLPHNEPKVTTPTRLARTVKPMRYGYPSYWAQPHQYQRQMRKNPIEPRNSPRAALLISSLRKTFHHSFNSTSRRASERMRMEVACEPELPPELMMSGTNSATTAAR